MKLWLPVQERDSNVTMFLLDRNESFGGMFIGNIEVPKARVHGTSTKTFDSMKNELPQPPKYPDLLIHHMSYSGSTLLSHLLDQPGRSIVISEPDGCSKSEFDTYCRFYANMTNEKTTVKTIPLNTMKWYPFYSECQHVVIYAELLDFLLTCLSDASRIRLIKTFCLINSVNGVTENTIDAVSICCTFWLEMVKQYCRLIETFNDNVLLVYSPSLLKDPINSMNRISDFAGLNLDQNQDEMQRKITTHSKFRSPLRPSALSIQKMDRMIMVSSQLQSNRLLIHHTLECANDWIDQLFRHPLRVV